MAIVSILGCGWLGFPLAKRLVALGYTVNGSTTTSSKIPMLQAAGITPYFINLHQDQSEIELAKFLASKILILNIPPGRSSGKAESFPMVMQQLAEQIQKSTIQYVLFVSSTSVYANIDGVVTEETPRQPDTVSGKALVEVENLFQKNTSWSTTIVRPGGLYSVYRHPGRFLAGKTGLKNGNEYVNLIHQHDIIEIIVRILARDCWGETFNCCADAHPTKREYYTKAAIEAGLEPPQFEAGGSSGKWIQNDKVKSVLAMEFKYADLSL